MTLNVPNILALADFIETQDIVEFDLRSYFGGTDYDPHTPTPPACATCACIAGEALLLFDPTTPVLYEDVSKKAQKLLGLNFDEACSLFTPHLPYDYNWKDITPAHAAQVLRHLAETGRVDWTILP